MLNEIINFTKIIRKNNFEIFEGISKKGLHILITLKENNDYEIKHSYLRKDEKPDDLIKSISFQEKISSVFDYNKCIAHKKISSINPYTFYFKLYSSTSEKYKINEFKNYVHQNENDINNINNYLKVEFSKQLTFIIEQSEKYFNIIIKDYYDENNDKDLIVQIKKIQKFCKEKLLEILFDKIKIIPELYLIDEKINLDLLDAIIWINFKIDDSVLKDSSNRYFQKKLFTKNDYNKIVNNEIYGLSSFYNDDNQKKLFLQHRTALFTINNLIKYDNLLELKDFETLIVKKKLPNPLPIFIDKEELNSKVIKLFNPNQEKLRYSEIIKQLLEKEKYNIEDLNNYYLFYFFKNAIVDFDYVSCFRYKIDEMNIQDFFYINSNHTIEISNIFDFESIVISKIFNNSLVAFSKKDDGYSIRYFEDIDSKYVRPAILNIIYKYRKAIYDYIYKSKIEAINSQMFKDIIFTSIFDDLKLDEYKNKKHTKEFSIKEKLNIYFSINHFFDKNNKNFGGYYMPSKIPELENRLIQIANNENEHIKNDEEFGYAAGQIIYYLLLQSETSNKTHALLEPFIQKVEHTLFKDAIAKTVNKYKHNLDWYGKIGKGRFEKLISEVLGFEPEKKISDLISFILAGYFAKSIIFIKVNEEEKNNGNTK